MKIKSITPTKSGMEPYAADSYWENLASFAGYGFNKSHAIAYSLISYTTMWIKVHYPAEFYAAAMTVIDKEEQLAALVADAQTKKLQVLPPNINRSSDRIEIEGEDKLYAPFQAVKGISSNAAKSIVELRVHFGGKFTDLAQLSEVGQREIWDRVRLNAPAREKLGKVGAFYTVDGVGFSPTHPDRLKDRLELIPGFTVESVKPDRALSVDTLSKIKVTRMIEDIRACDGCSLKGAPHPLPRMGASPRFMVVFDTPSWKEEKAGKMLEGDSADILKAALKDVGLKASDGYYTALVKSQKPKDQKVISNAQISACTKWLDQEIEILKPPVIIAMGSNAVRHFAKGIKGTPADLAGKVIYNAELDASVILGLSLGSLFHDPSKITLVEKVTAALSDLLA